MSLYVSVRIQVEVVVEKSDVRQELMNSCQLHDETENLFLMIIHIFHFTMRVQLHFDIVFAHMLECSV